LMTTARHPAADHRNRRRIRQPSAARTARRREVAAA
jgi:hypothetical protein